VRADERSLVTSTVLPAVGPVLGSSFDGAEIGGTLMALDGLRLTRSVGRMGLPLKERCEGGCVGVAPAMSNNFSKTDCAGVVYSPGSSLRVVVSGVEAAVAAATPGV